MKDYQHCILLLKEDIGWQKKKMESTVREVEPELKLRIENKIEALEELLELAKTLKKNQSQ